MELPKYARLECERRFLLAGPAPSTTRVGHIFDRYVDNARLRLRRIEREDGSRVWKLSKKWPGSIARALVTIYLDENEYGVLATLPAATLEKRRCHLDDGWCVDVFAGDADGLVLCEIEADSEAEVRAVSLPAFVGREVTHDARFDGGSIARAAAASVRAAVDDVTGRR